MAFRSEHGLDFEIAEWVPLPGFPASKEFKRFRVGSCTGLWRSTKDSYDILAITNKNKGNGHFDDVLQWFEHSCIRDKKAFRILEVWNKKLKTHLLTQRSFIDIGGDNVEKSFPRALHTKPNEVDLRSSGQGRVCRTCSEQT